MKAFLRKTALFLALGFFGSGLVAMMTQSLRPLWGRDLMMVSFFFSLISFAFREAQNRSRIR